MFCPQVLLSAGAAVGAADVQGMTALHLASASGHTALLALLLASGANANAQASNANMPKHSKLKCCEPYGMSGVQVHSLWLLAICLPEALLVACSPLPCKITCPLSCICLDDC